MYIPGFPRFGNSPRRFDNGSRGLWYRESGLNFRFSFISLSTSPHYIVYKQVNQPTYRKNADQQSDGSEMRLIPEHLLQCLKHGIGFLIERFFQDPLGLRQPGLYFKNHAMIESMINWRV